MTYCDKHRQSMPIDECPICVREERNRLREAFDLINALGIIAGMARSLKEGESPVAWSKRMLIAEEERDRYRKALEEIITVERCHSMTAMYSAPHRIAGKALEGKE